MIAKCSWDPTTSSRRSGAAVDFVVRSYGDRINTQSAEELVKSEIEVTGRDEFGHRILVSLPLSHVTNLSAIIKVG